MKKTVYLLVIQLICLSTLDSNAQSNTLSFDGVDDYIDLGQSAGNGVRTMEMWFNLNSPIDSTLTESATLVSRSSSGCGNCHLFYVAFTPTGWTGSNTGKIMFQIRDASGSVISAVYSDQNSWNAGEWHHVAAVADQTEGTMLFIDGMKQLDVDAGGINSTTTDTRITAIGKWGEGNVRYFDGKIDDIRFSSIARYASDFTPPCPGDFSVDPNTLALWNLDEGTGTTAGDNSTNAFNGLISGASWDNDSICTTISSEEIDAVNKSNLRLHPNPVKDRAVMKISLPDSPLELVRVEIRDMLGTLIKVVPVTNRTNMIELELSDVHSGVYFYTLIHGGKIIETIKIIHL